MYRSSETGEEDILKSLGDLGAGLKAEFAKNTDPARMKCRDNFITLDLPRFVVVECRFVPMTLTESVAATFQTIRQ